MSKPRKPALRRHGKTQPMPEEIRRASSEALELARRFAAIGEELAKVLHGGPLVLPLAACPKAATVADVLAHVHDAWAQQRGATTRTHDLMMLCAILERAERRVIERVGMTTEGHMENLRSYLRSYLPGIEGKLTDAHLLAFLREIGLPSTHACGGEVRKRRKRHIFWAAVVTLARTAGFKSGTPGSLQTRFSTWRKETRKVEVFYSPPSGDADSPDEDAF